MSKNTNLSFLTDFLTADIVNSRVGMNNVSPQATFDVTGTGKFSGILTLGSTVSNGTYTYTLPSATGTLALTSDIPSVSGYVPYTGATQAVNLGYNSLSASFLRVDGAGPTLGSYLGFKHSTNVTTGADGYTSIYTFGTNTIAFKSISGATTRDFSFSMASITPGVSGGRIYTLPDADGTLALTSQIPANAVGGTGTTNYLPKFTGSTTIGNSLIIEGTNTIGINTTGYTISAGYTGLGINNATNGGALDLLLNDVKKGEFYITSSSFNMYGFAGVGINLTVNNDVSKNLSIATTGNVLIGTTTDNGARLQVSGAATVSGILTSGSTSSGFINSKSLLIGTDGTETNYRYQFYLSSNNLLLYSRGFGDLLTINYTSGAATFSSSVTATSGIFSAVTSINIGPAGGNVFTVDKLTGGNIAFYANGVYSGQIDATASGSLNLASRGTYPAITITSGGNVLIGTTTDSGSKLRVSGGNLQIDGGFQKMYTYYIIVQPNTTGTVTISSPTGTNMQGSMQVMAGGYGNSLSGNVTGLWMVGGLLFFNNASTSTITQIVNSVTANGSMSFQRSSDQYTVTLSNTSSTQTKTLYVSVIINGD